MLEISIFAQPRCQQCKRKPGNMAEKAKRARLLARESTADSNDLPRPTTGKASKGGTEPQPKDKKSKAAGSEPQPKATSKAAAKPGPKVEPKPKAAEKEPKKPKQPTASKRKLAEAISGIVTNLISDG